MMALRAETCNKIPPINSFYTGYVNEILIIVVLWWIIKESQSVRFGAKPLEADDQRFFFFLQLNPCSRSPYATSSLTRGGVCPLCILWCIYPLLSGNSASSDFSGQRLGQHVPRETNMHATIEFLLETGCFLCGPCPDVILRTTGAMSWIVSSTSQQATAWAV
jgi:hypothetical protein